MAPFRVKTLRTYLGSQTFTHCNPISHQDVSASFPYMLMFNQFGGMKRPDVNSSSISLLLLASELFFLLHRRDQIFDKIQGDTVSLSMLDPLLDISHIMTGCQRLHDMGH